MKQNILESNAPPPEAEDDIEAERDQGYLSAKELMLSKLYEEGAADGLAKAIAAAPDPVQGAIEQTINLLDVLEEATQGAVPDELVMQFVVEVIGEVLEIAEQAGIQIADEEIPVVAREVLAQVVETMGGDATAIREEMNSIDPAEIARAAQAQVPEEA